MKIIGELRDLVTYQEDYIQQLEEELGFCRNHLAETIDKVRHTTLTQEKETQGVIEKLNAENSSLKQQMENKHEALKRDNVWLVNAVQGLKDETMELQRYATLPFLILSLRSGKKSEKVRSKKILE